MYTLSTAGTRVVLVIVRWGTEVEVLAFPATNNSLMQVIPGVN